MLFWANGFLVFNVNHTPIILSKKYSNSTVLKHFFILYIIVKNKSSVIYCHNSSFILSTTQKHFYIFCACVTNNDVRQNDKQTLHSKKVIHILIPQGVDICKLIPYFINTLWIINNYFLFEIFFCLY